MMPVSTFIPKIDNGFKIVLVKVINVGLQSIILSFFVINFFFIFIGNVSGSLKGLFGQQLKIYIFVWLN